jgi:hypothetical protein
LTNIITGRLLSRGRSSDVDLGEAGFGILAFVQIARRLDQDHFQGRPDTCLDQVAADDTAIGFAENGMEMQDWALVSWCKCGGPGGDPPGPR